MPAPLLGCPLPSPTLWSSHSSTSPLGCCTHAGDDGAAALSPAGSLAAPGNRQLHTHLGQPCGRSSQLHPPAFYERKKNPALAFPQLVLRNVLIILPKNSPLPFDKSKRASCMEKTQPLWLNLIRSGKQGHFREASTIYNTTSLDYVRNQILIPSTTGPLRPAVSEPHEAGGPGLRTPSVSCRIRASQRSRSACQPRQFRSPELLTMLHCNTLCISNHLFLQFWVSSAAVTQKRAEDFIPRSTEFGVAFEDKMLGNNQDRGAGWVPKMVQE